jgi:O-antigen ligase
MSALNASLQSATRAAMLHGFPLLGVGFLGGYLVMYRSSLALALGSIFLVVGFALVPGRTRLLSTKWPFRWIPITWVVLLFLSDIKSERRDPLAATTGKLSHGNVIELAAYLLIAIIVLMVWLHFRPQRSKAREWPVIAWPVFALASTAWSLTPLFTFARAWQLVTVGIFAILCLRLAHGRPGLRHAIVMDTLRLFIIVTALFSLWGLADRSAWAGERYVWPTGAHPIAVGMVVGGAFLLVLVGGRTLTGVSWPTHVFLAMLFLSVLVLGQNRSTLITTFLALLATPWVVRSRRRVEARFIAFPALVYSSVILALVAGQVFLEYFARGQSSRLLLTLTGRTDLWESALRQLESPDQWLHGSGYGTARVILLRLFAWGGHAHNVLIELLLGLGIIGAGMAMASILMVGYRALAAKHAKHRVVGAAEAAVFIHLLLGAVVESGLVIPGFPFVMLVLIFVAVSDPDEFGRFEEPHGQLSSHGEPVDRRWRRVAISADRDRR